jgi:hypothetical protein
MPILFIESVALLLQWRNFAMAKYEVIIYAYTSFTVEAESPEQANEIALNCPIGFEMVKQGECPEVLDYHWSWSDAMGSEVYDEQGEIALCDW